MYDKHRMELLRDRAHHTEVETLSVDQLTMLCEAERLRVESADDLATTEDALDNIKRARAEMKWREPWSW